MAAFNIPWWAASCRIVRVVDVRIEDGPGQFGMFVVGLGFDFFWVCGGLSGHVIVAGARWPSFAFCLFVWFWFSSAAPRG